MNKDKVSVIIPVHNVENYIERCIKSLINQTYKNIEIICVDDESSDNSGKICDELASIDKRIISYHIKPCRIGTARNFGLKKASGSYILFLDSDDHIVDNAIEKLVSTIKEGYDIVCCGFDRIDEETQKVYCTEMINMPYDELTLSDENFMEVAFLNPACWGKLFSKKIIKDIDFIEHANEDMIYYLEFIPRVKNIKFIKEPLWHYMVKKSSGMANFNLKNAIDFEDDLLVIKDKYIKNGYSKNIHNFLTMQVIMHNCISVPSRLYNKKDININKWLKNVKQYMNDNFSDWKNIKIKVKGRLIKKIAIHVIIVMYRLNIFKLFLCIYNFMITKLKIDIKW